MNENLKSTSQDVLDSNPSPDKRERSVTIPVAKLWWAAAVVLLTLAVSAYPYVCLVRSGQSIEGSSWWIVVFSVVNVITAALILWYLFRSNKRRSGVLSCFIPALMIAFVGGVGALPGGGTQHATVFMCLFALGVILHFADCIVSYLRLRQETEAEIEDPDIYAGFSLLLVCLLSFVALDWKSMEMWWVPVVVLGVCLLLFCCLMVCRGDEDLSIGMLMLSSILIFCVRSAPWLWYSIVYTAAEYATYHDMPAVVDICLPKSPNLSPCQREHFPARSYSYSWAWYEKALKYAVQHGDVRASRAYLRIIDSKDLNHQISELGKDVNLLPLLDWVYWPFGRSFSDIDLEYSAVVKQMSYDEPEMLDSLIQKSEAEDACITGIMKHNAYKNALFLMHRKGCNARYATAGCCEKYTLLQSAVESRNLEMAELLLKNGADPDYAQDGDTPRRMAEKMNWQYVLNMFGPEPSSAQ